MLVVLTVLVLLTGVAVRTLEGIQDQARYEAAGRALSNVEDAVLGPSAARGADGALFVTGFAADLGRLPLAVGADPGAQMEELWANPRGLFSSGLRPAPSDAEVLVECGWRGPYLRLSPGEKFLRDGWGNALSLRKGDRVSAVSDGDPVEVVLSLGADGAEDALPTDSYDTDLRVAFSATAAPVVDRWRASVGGRVYERDLSTGALRDPDPALGAVTIRYFGPDPATGGVQELSAVVSPPFASVSYSFPSVSIGPRVLRAYQGAKRSVAARIALMAGGNGKDLVLE